MNFRTAISALIFLSSLPAQGVEFNRDIRPILSDKCFHCHGPDPETREEGLRLDSFAGATEKGVIKPGKPDESEFMKRILHTDKDEVMPPVKSHKKITKETNRFNGPKKRSRRRSIYGRGTSNG
jgi:hypothetical protein